MNIRKVKRQKESKILYSSLEENDNEFLIAICHKLNCEGWERGNAKGDIDLQFCDKYYAYYQQI